MAVLYAIASVLSAGAAVLAWWAKIQWAKEYREARDAQVTAKDAALAAKDETLAAKEGQVESLRERLATFEHFTPMKIREYFDSVTEQLDEYAEHLKGKIGGLERQIESLRARGVQKDEALAEANAKLSQLRVELRDAESASAAGGIAKAVANTDFVTAKDFVLTLKPADRTVTDAAFFAKYTRVLRTFLKEQAQTETRLENKDEDAGPHEDEEEEEEE